MTHGFETLAIHAGQEPDPTTGAVVPPIYQISTFKQDGVGGLRGGYEYSRSANPTRTALEECLAALEGGRRGLAFASGLAAEDTLLRTVLEPGDHVVDPGRRLRRDVPAVRPRARALGRRAHARPGCPTSTPSARRSSPGATQVVWVETPTNPLLGIADIEALAEVAHDAGALLVVDNTFAVAVPAAAAARSAPTWSCTRRRSTSAGTPTWSVARSWSGRRRARRNAWPTTRTRWARSPGRSTRGWCCAGRRPWGCAWTGTAPTPSGWSSVLVAHPTVHAGLLPRPARPPRPRRRRQADAGLRRDGVVPRRRRRGGGPRGLRPAAALHPRRVARRRRVAHRAPGPDDPRARWPARRSRCPTTSSGCRSASRRSTTCWPT